MGWETLTCTLGHTHEVYRQEKTDECAIACAAMVVQRLNGDKPSLSDLRSHSQDHTGGYRPSTRDAGTLLAVPTAQKGVAQQMASIMRGRFGGGHIGTMTVDNLPALLAASPYFLTAVAESKQNGTAIRNVLKTVSASRKFVIRINWDDGSGGHAILVDACKRNLFSADQFCICDPGAGVVVATLKPDAAPHLPPNVSDLPYSAGHVKMEYVRVE
jgi:hypothetical protein